MALPSNPRRPRSMAEGLHPGAQRIVLFHIVTQEMFVLGYGR